MVDYEEIESSQRQHHEIMLHEERRCAAGIVTDYTLFSMLKPKLYKDGNEWCCLYGDDIQSGIVGFGETPDKAVSEWRSAWHKK